jgi:glycosidase
MVTIRSRPVTERVRARATLLVLAGACALVAFPGTTACSSDAAPTYPTQSCLTVVWHKPASASAKVGVLTSATGFRPPGVPLEARADGWRVGGLALPPGPQTYVVVEDGAWIPDRNVGTTAWRDGKEVTWLDVPDCRAPVLRVEGTSARGDGTASAKLTFVAAAEGDATALDPASITVTGASATASADPATGRVDLAVSGLGPGKTTLIVTAKDGAGRSTPPRRLIVWNEATPFDWRDAAIYQVMVDRYQNGTGAVAPPSVPSAFAGGTLDGLRARIEDGTLTKLGFDAIWMTPVYVNPPGFYPGTDGNPYSGYHGYWPVDSRAVDPRFGGDAALDALIAAAHARGIRLIYDVVPHHVHEEHPYAKAHPEWMIGAGCTCGTATCDWGTHIQDCRFAEYLPTVDWKRDDVAATITEDVALWLDRFDGDGLRFDAVPMMPRSAMRRIASVVRARFDHPGHDTYLIGENFVGPGNFDLLKYQLGPYGLDGEFHFPLMWALRGALAQGVAPLSDVDRAVRAGEDAWKGSGATMGLMIGNHDVTRFASEAAGDADGDGWIAAAQPTSAAPYARQRAALSLVFTLPGIPVVYYGDEIALAGRRDPDSRRTMPAESALLPEQKATRDFVAKLGAARKCAVALRRGTYRPLVVEGETLAFAREDGAHVAVVVTSRSDLPMEMPLVGIAKGTWVDLLTGDAVQVDPAMTRFPSAAYRTWILVPKGDECAQ